MKNILLLVAIIVKLNAVSQIPPYVSTTGLIGWWPFNGNANDESGHGYNGINYGASLTQDRFGNPNSAYSFNGINNYISVNEQDSFYANGVSVSAWIKLNNSPGLAQYLVSKGPDSASGHFSLNFYENPAAVYGGLGAGGAKNASSSISDTTPQLQWHHIVLTYDLSVLKIYIDNILSATNSCSLPIGVTPSPILFGKHSMQTNPYYTNGVIDDIGIWNLALTHKQITALYNSIITNIDFVEENSTMIYPNPAKNFITVRISESIGIIKITDVLGQILVSEKIISGQKEIDISHLPNGIYFVNNRKFVKD